MHQFAQLTLLGDIDDTRLEIALRDSEASFRRLAENLPDCIIRFDADGLVVNGWPDLARKVAR